MFSCSVVVATYLLYDNNFSRAMVMQSGEELMQKMSHNRFLALSVSDFLTGKMTPWGGNAATILSQLSTTPSLVTSKGNNSMKWVLRCFVIVTA